MYYKIIRHAVPAFNVTEGATFLIIHFEPNYHMAGSPPHGHEIVVWDVKYTGTTSGPFSYYFELSLLKAEVKNLQPATNYTLYARSNSIRTNNHGRWTARAVRTMPVGEYQSLQYIHILYMPHIWQIVPGSCCNFCVLLCVVHLSLHAGMQWFISPFIHSVHL